MADKTTAEELAQEVFDKTAHGDDEHRAWLRDALAQAILASPVIAKIEREAEARGAADTRAKVIALVESGMYNEYGRPQPELVKAIREMGEQP